MNIMAHGFVIQSFVSLQLYYYIFFGETEPFWLIVSSRWQFRKWVHAGPCVMTHWTPSFGFDRRRRRNGPTSAAGITGQGLFGWHDPLIGSVFLSSISQSKVFTCLCTGWLKTYSLCMQLRALHQIGLLHASSGGRWDWEPDVQSVDLYQCLIRMCRNARTANRRKLWPGKRQ